jgi:hypothetical protein
MAQPKPPTPGQPVVKNFFSRSIGLVLGVNTIRYKHRYLPQIRIGNRGLISNYKTKPIKVYLD